MKIAHRLLLAASFGIGLHIIIGTIPLSYAAPLNTQLPQEETILSGQINLSQPAQPLSSALKTLSTKAGLNITFNDALVSGKNAPALNGTMSVKQALQKLLTNTGLETKINATTIYIERIPEKSADLNLKLEDIQVRAKRFYEIGPLPGLGLTKEEIPGNVQSISAKEIKESHSLSITDLMNKKLQSVNVNDYQGNPFQMDVTYRGFSASPQVGTPQGLSVFLDGIRVNEPFGDVVNWDMIPMNALSGLDVFPGSNPIFGLGTLGGALSMKTKDGFANQGVAAEVLTGSFGRKQLQVSSGWNNGTVGLFGAGNFFLEDGWRDNSPSRVNQVFGKASYRGDKLDLNLSSLIVTNELVGNGLIPSEMYSQNPSGVFTSPDTTNNKLFQFQLSGSYFVNDNFTITGQVYRRNSKRHQKGADAYTQYGSTPASKNMDAGDQFTCLYASTNKYGLPDYYVVSVPENLFDILGVVASGDTANTLYQVYQNDNNVKFVVDGLLGNVDMSLLAADAKNKDLPDNYAAYAQYNLSIYKNYRVANLYLSQANGLNTYNPPNPPSEITLSDGTSAAKYQYLETSQVLASPQTTTPVDVGVGLSNYYYTDNGNGTYTKNLIMTAIATNQAECSQGQLKYTKNATGGIADLDANGVPKQYDGAQTGGTGLVTGVPTAVITETQIDQIVNGASMQLNWNLDKHKLMVGSSIDSAGAKYRSGQRLGFFDAMRNAYLDPTQALDVFAAADEEVMNNNFDGTSVTKSAYLSETWSPVDKVNVTSALRYNITNIKNTIASRSYGFAVLDLHEFTAEPDDFNTCNPGDPCITGYKIPDLSRLLNPAETEKFTYKSLNPSIGATWQANENINIYSNWAQGARTPSVIELGCAIDKTLVPSGGKMVYKSIAENRSCSLPSTLSGDPHLPQIKATTYDVGMRGTFNNWRDISNIEWNLGAYRTDLKDDIYMVTFPGNRSFFDTIGKTRRQGIEAGISGQYEKAKFKLNYALTDATFQDSFVMAANDNSSSVPNEALGVTTAGEAVSRSITVNPGNRMPGVPLNNLNFNFTYELTPKWTMNLTAVAHSASYVRGNENNQHQVGVTQYVTYTDPTTGQNVTVARQPSNNPGKVAGYVTLNFQTRYQLSREWALGLQVTNLLDKEYFSAGRLGRNPFSPSILGAVGPDGYNHNSTDWLSTNFIAPGAPRGVWMTLSYEFMPDPK